MDYFLLFGLIGFGLLFVGLIGYSAITKKIIKDQEQEIEILKTDNERLRSSIAKLERIKRVTELSCRADDVSKDKIINLFKEF